MPVVSDRYLQEYFHSSGHGSVLCADIYFPMTLIMYFKRRVMHKGSLTQEAVMPGCTLTILALFKSI